MAEAGTDSGFKAAAKQALIQNPALRGAKIVIEEYLEDAQSNKGSAAHTGQGTDSSSRPCGEPVVLLVGGGDNLLAVVRIVLYDVPHKLVWAQSPAEVVDLIQKQPPSIILGESVSSNADGFNLIQIAKTHAETAETPVVLLNPESNLDSIFAAYSAINRKHSESAPEPLPLVPV
ncbi:MAG TPA: hypothetical protein VEZ90_15330 [Blastocatellia bacterium]|nr:hypothetical protein [Blastocatellia bacterium]